MGFADSPATINALAGHGIRVTGYVWHWHPGQKDGIYPPHQDLNGHHEATADSFDAWPGEDANGDSCMCNVPPIYRTADGRFAKPGLEPIFQPPATASLQMFPTPEPIDWSPLVAALTEQREFTLSVPDGAFTINLPELNPTFHVAAPSVNVEAAKAPDVTVTPTFAVEPVTVTMDSPTVTVAAPNVTVEPRIEIKPVVKVIREKVAKAVRFRRNANGQITEAEVTSDG